LTPPQPTSSLFPYTTLFRSYVVSICTGSLLLGAAGLLRGRTAACHWASRHLLAAFGAQPTDERVVKDGNVLTGGGVTAGIDVALDRKSTRLNSSHDQISYAV